VPDLLTTLGYDAKAQQIAEALRQDPPPLGDESERDGALDERADIVVIQGPAGVGKSGLAQTIGGMWENGGGSTVVAKGDSVKRDAAFHPFRTALTPLPRRWRTIASAAAGVAKAGEVLLGTAGIITNTIEALVKVRAGRRRQRTPFLGDAEQEVLSELERLSERTPLLLIADNLHWWDSTSLEFLIQLRDPGMRSAFPFLADMRVLAVQTPEPHQSIAHPDAHDALLVPSETHYFELEPIPRHRFEAVLAALGADPVPSAAVTETVYAFSGGHLALASQCADRIAKGETDAFLAAAGFDEFVRALLTDRMRSLGARGKQAVALLQVAAVVGLTFRRDEVACASGSPEAQTSQLLRYCRDERMLELDEGIGTFVHELYRQYFLQAALHDRTGVHERLADCLRRLRPAEYDLRCRNAVDAERPREAAVLAAQAGLQRERDGQPWQELPRPSLDAIAAGGLDLVMERLVAAFHHLHRDRFRDCLTALGALPHDLPKPLLAEADYIRATCLMSTRSDDDRAEGRDICELWDGYEEVEPELGIRLMQLHVYGLTLIVGKESGRDLEKRIRRALNDRVSFDQAAKDGAYTMDRCAGSLHQPDVAVYRNERAAEHFGPEEGQTVLRRPVEYYKCLVNFGANLIATAQYKDALRVYGDLERLVTDHAEGVFPRLDYPRMNVLLAEYRLGLVRDDEAVQRQRDIATSLDVAGDPFYPRNALAVYLILGRQDAEALDTFDRLLAELTRRRNPEPSTLYLIRANRCVVRFLSGHAEESQAEWADLAGVVDRIPYAIQPILARRHELLADVMERGGVTSAHEFDECLFEEWPHEFGPLWNQLGRGFRMPEVEWWN
jgi:hypothetical protein